MELQHRAAQQILQGQLQQCQSAILAVQELVKPALAEKITSRQAQEALIECEDTAASTKVSRCIETGCQCRCHTIVAASGRFWSIEASSMQRLLQSCDRPGCNTRQYSICQRIALSRYGLNFAVVIGFRLGYGPAGYTLAPSLRLSPIVPYTSPGFQILWKMSTEQVSMEEGFSDLDKLFQARKISPYDVDPSGRGWVQVTR